METKLALMQQASVQRRSKASWLVELLPPPGRQGRKIPRHITIETFTSSKVILILTNQLNQSIGNQIKPQPKRLRKRLLVPQIELS